MLRIRENGVQSMDHKKILIVDDEPVIAEELSEFLESFDYACSTALSVDEALGKISEDADITMILTDMRMPGRDGADLIRELKAHPERQFEFVMISGHLDADQDLDDIKGSDLTLMRKPVDVEALINHLEARDFPV